MTDFGQRPSTDGATEAKQDDVLTALGILHTDVASTILALIDGVEGALLLLHTDVATNVVGHIDGIEAQLATLEADIEALTAQATHVLVDNIQFDDDPTSYTAGYIDVSAYRDFLLLISVTVTNSPTDIVIRVMFSDQATAGHLFVNGPFGDLRYAAIAGTKTEAIHGKCLAPYMSVYVLATGTDASNSFTLTVKAVLTR